MFHLSSVNNAGNMLSETHMIKNLVPAAKTVQRIVFSYQFF